jgi:hypothetical protein
MTTENDRLLAEGPRTAPEPLTAPGIDGSAPAAPPPFFGEPAPEVPVPSSPPPSSASQPASPVRLAPRPAGPGRRSRPTSVRLLLPVVAIALAVGRSALHGHGGAGPVLGVISVLVLIGLIGLRGRRW